MFEVLLMQTSAACECLSPPPAATAGDVAAVTAATAAAAAIAAVACCAAGTRAGFVGGVPLRWSPGMGVGASVGVGCERCVTPAAELTH